MEKWVGNVALVTGASAGIGMVLCLELAKEGVIVVGVSRRPELLEARKSELTEGQAENLHSLKCDVTNDDDVDKVIDWIRTQYGSLHILVNNAGVVGAGSLTDGPTSMIRQTIDVNVYGLCSVTTKSLRLMRESNIELGHIINVNSVLGHKTLSSEDYLIASFNVYGGTKFAVTAITEVLRKELIGRKLNVRVTSISPGLVQTDIFAANNFEPTGIVYTRPHLQAKEVVSSILYILQAPPEVNISELTIQATGEDK